MIARPINIPTESTIQPPMAGSWSTFTTPTYSTSAGLGMLNGDDKQYTTFRTWGEAVAQQEYEQGIRKCTYCHEYQRPTPLGHCPGCGAGMAG
jgi:hypothetical protein